MITLSETQFLHFQNEVNGSLSTVFCEEKRRQHVNDSQQYLFYKVDDYGIQTDKNEVSVTS